MVKIGSSDVESVAIRAKELIAHENQAMLKLNTPRYLILAEVLQAQGVLPTAEKGQFTFQDAEGRPFEMEVTPLLGSEVGELVSADEAATKPMYRQKPEVAYWFQYLEDSRTLYVQYNQCREIEGQSFKDFSKQVLSFVDAHTVDRFVLDLRHNGGGNSTIAEPLIAGIKQARDQQEGPLRNRWALEPSRRPSSTLSIKNETEAIFVGEPTAGKPNHYGEVKPHPPQFRPKGKLLHQVFPIRKDDTPSFEPDLGRARSSRCPGWPRPGAGNNLAVPAVGFNSRELGKMDYSQFVAEVQQRAEFESPEDAEKAIDAVLETLESG